MPNEPASDQENTSAQADTQKADKQKPKPPQKGDPQEPDPGGRVETTGE
ncbi:MAG TPA: hypothetical protein VM715_22270 [Candidatus Acidoferrum sp.]|nr:hypothetical protein [Candidatus Acidoferrum sp.]